MQKKLTLRLDETLVEKAKIYAAEHGKSVSQMVAEYFQFLETGTPQPTPALGTKTRALKGLLDTHQVNEDDYNRYRDEKYQ